MPQDKFTALWVSHSSISDYLHCKRSYYLKNIYRDPKTRHKVKLMSPPLALGQAVHEVIESLSVLPVADRFKELLTDKFEKAWENVSGKKGGFPSDDVESKYKARGRDMISRVVKNPGPVERKAVKIKEDLPYYWISEEDNIILCGKIDWLEYIPETDSVNILDFKTSKYDEDGDSLQLPIYYLLVKNCQHRLVTKASYWYLDRNDEPTEVQLPDEQESTERILAVAREIKLAKQLNRFVCETNGCQYCNPMEAILKSEAELIGQDNYNADVYILKDNSVALEDKSEIL